MSSTDNSWGKMHGEGAITQHKSGVWYIRRDGYWQRMTEQEIATHLQNKETK